MKDPDYNILQEPLDGNLKDYIQQGFREHSIASLGHHGDINDLTLVARREATVLGVLHGKSFWGGFHIKNLYVKGAVPA